MAKKADSGSPMRYVGALGWLAILVTVSVAMTAGACDSAPARSSYVELRNLPTVEPDGWFASLATDAPSASTAQGHVKGAARLGMGEVAVFSSGRDCGFAFRSSDGAESVFFGEPSAASAGVADGIDAARLVTEAKGRGGVAAGVTDAVANKVGASISVGAICSDYYAAFILPQSFAVGSAGTTRTQGATSERTLPDGRLVIVVGDSGIRDIVGDAIARLAKA